MTATTTHWRGLAIAGAGTAFGMTGKSFGLPEPCQAPPRKIFCFTVFLICVITQPARAAKRDVSRSSRSVARVAMDACGVRRGLPARRNAAAYGEIVWSWRRDRGVY